MDEFIKNHQIYVKFFWFALGNFLVFNFLDKWLLHKKMEIGSNLFSSIFLALAWMAIVQKYYSLGISLLIFAIFFARIAYKALFPLRSAPTEDEQIPNP